MDREEGVGPSARARDGPVMGLSRRRTEVQRRWRWSATQACLLCSEAAATVGATRPWYV